jgi:hypothetical protein
MKSQQILPIKNRLDKFQVLELEGIKNKATTKSHFDSSIFTKDELLLKYHKALEEAEKQIIELSSDNDRLIEELQER